MTIEEKKRKVLESIPNFENWEDKYRFIIEKGKQLPAMATHQKQEKFRVEGCISRAYLCPEYKDGKLFFYADSDAAIVKGIIAILLDVYSEQSPDEILSLDPSFLKEVGIEDHLSMNRRNGLAHICKQIRLYALLSKSGAASTFS